MIGIIRGEIKDSKTRKYIPNAKLICSAPGHAKPASSVNNGIHFVFGPTGKYTLTASATGYQSKTQQVQIIPPSPLKPFPVVRINLTPTT